MGERRGKRRILCFGDSLTWGWIPTADGPPTQRYGYEERWTGVMASMLGDSVVIIEEGLSGRTTELDDPIDPRLNGADYLPSAIASHMPLDIVIIMLGTNDTKRIFNRTPFQITSGVARLVSQINSSAGGVGTIYPAPAPFLVAPPPLGAITHPWQVAKFEGAKQKSIDLASLYTAFADFEKIGFLDAGKIIATDGVDGIHLTARNNIDLGLAMGKALQRLLNDLTD